MKSDLSRLTFNPARRYSRVLVQQGRPPIDADFNEQAEILLTMIRQYTLDIIGAYGGPVGSFKIDPANVTTADFTIAKGRYYVAGLLCENPTDGKYSVQPLGPHTVIASGQQFPFPILAYLDVWEHHRSWIDDGVIIDPALGGIDTATRVRVVWQVGFQDLSGAGMPAAPTKDQMKGKLPVNPPNRGNLRVRFRPGPTNGDCCTVHDESRYRGVENQLYRVEIHTAGNGIPVGSKAPAPAPAPAPGAAAAPAAAPPPSPATFKWSRENGSVCAKWLQPSNCTAAGGLTLQLFGPRDLAHGFARGNWIEIIDESHELSFQPGYLAQIASVDGNAVTIVKPGANNLPAWSSFNNPKVRRWDQQDTGDGFFQGGVLFVHEAAGDDTEDDPWIDLENGLQIQFVAATTPQSYRAGDYWMIPVRVATGDVLWPWKVPTDALTGAPPKARPPDGVDHYYAPLAYITAANAATDLRSEFQSLARDV